MKNDHQNRPRDLLKDLKASYPKAKIVGHRDFPNVAKVCPCFDARSEYSKLNNMIRGRFL